jgi:RNA polymerase sigma factor (sigma-70 family)
LSWSTKTLLQKPTFCQLIFGEGIAGLNVIYIYIRIWFSKISKLPVKKSPLNVNIEIEGAHDRWKMTADPGLIPSIISSQTISAREILSREIEMRYSDLRTSVQVMVARSGFVEGEVKIIDTADELLHDTIETALRAADRFDPTRSVYSWLLGIAVNKLKEMRRDARYEKKRVQVFEDAEPNSNDSVEQSTIEGSEDATADERIDAVLYGSTNRSRLEDQTSDLDEMLSLVKEGEREILRLAIVEGMSGADLAATFGIQEGAAYMRLARAQEHLREKYLSIQARKDY